METDYYLHNNLHTKAGKGTFHSMETYERAFGVEWNEDDSSVRDNETPLSSPSLKAHKRIASDQSIGSRRRGSGTSLEKYSAGEGSRISQVRKRCSAQNEALSSWWKTAIQAYIQQRMWMQLGRNTSESMLPPRFERLYQPDKLEHFDHVFACSWATPVRSSHSSQHSTSVEEEAEIMEYRKNISGRIASSKGPERLKLHAASHTVQETDESSEDEMTLESFVNTCGLKPRVAPTLTRFIKPHESRQGLPRSPVRMGKYLLFMACVVDRLFVEPDS